MNHGLQSYSLKSIHDDYRSISFEVLGDDSVSIHYFIRGEELMLWRWGYNEITPNRMFPKKEARAFWREIVVSGGWVAVK